MDPQEVQHLNSKTSDLEDDSTDDEIAQHPRGNLKWLGFALGLALVVGTFWATKRNRIEPNDVSTLDTVEEWGLPSVDDLKKQASGAMGGAATGGISKAHDMAINAAKGQIQAGVKTLVNQAVAKANPAIVAAVSGPAGQAVKAADGANVDEAIAGTLKSKLDPIKAGVQTQVKSAAEPLKAKTKTQALAALATAGKQALAVSPSATDSAVTKALGDANLQTPKDIDALVGTAVKDSLMGPMFGSLKMPSIRRLRSWGNTAVFLLTSLWYSGLSFPTIRLCSPPSTSTSSKGTQFPFLFSSKHGSPGFQSSMFHFCWKYSATLIMRFS